MRPADRVEAERLQEALRERLNPGWREQLAMHRTVLEAARLEREERQKELATSKTWKTSTSTGGR